MKEGIYTSEGTVRASQLIGSHGGTDMADVDGKSRVAIVGGGLVREVSSRKNLSFDFIFNEIERV